MSGAANAGEPRKAELKFSGFLLVLGCGGGFENKGTREQSQEGTQASPTGIPSYH